MCAFHAILYAKKAILLLQAKKDLIFDTGHSTSEWFYIQRWKDATVSVQEAAMQRELIGNTFGSWI